MSLGNEEILRRIREDIKEVGAEIEEVSRQINKESETAEHDIQPLIEKKKGLERKLARLKEEEEIYGEI